MFTHLLVLVLTTVVWLEGTFGIDVSNIDISEDFIRQAEILQHQADESDESFFGFLHTQDAFLKWADKEDEITEVLEKRLQLIDEEIALITEYLEDYDESTGEAMRHLKEPKETPEERGRVVGSSAVLGHRMVSRYAGVIAQIRRFLTSDDFLENEVKLAKILEETQEFVFDEATNQTKRVAPGLEDLFLTMSSFFHVQKVYGYRPSQLIHGFNPNNSKAPDASQSRISALQCTEIGILALYQREYQIAVEWLEMAETLLADWRDEEDDNVPLNVVSSIRSLSIQQHNRKFQIPELKTNQETILNFYDQSITPYNNRIPVRDLVFENKQDLPSNASINAEFMNLCLGNDPRPLKIRQKLKCYYQRKRHPYLYINPVKVEQLSKNPPIFQVYEMVGNKTIEYLKYTYGDKVHPTKDGGLNGEIIPYLNTGAYKKVNSSQVPAIMFDLPSAITGLVTGNIAETSHYAEYVEGRWFHNHPDSLQTAVKMLDEDHGISPYDEWAASIAYYLEVPKLGGDTAYSHGGVRSNPVRGSAVIWYNTYNNGTLRNDINHGVCPVLKGHKITLNMWIRYLDNWKNFKCKLNQFK